MSSPLRVGIVGAGNFARRQHLPNLARIPEARIAAICDRDKALAHDLADRYGADLVTTEARRLFDDPGIPAVVIAVRDDLQVPLAMEAVRAGKSVYVEKPFPVSEEQAIRIRETCDRSGLHLAVGFNKRFAPAYRRAREVMNRHGGPRNMHFRMTDDAWRWAHGYPPGHLLSLDVCHFMDLARWFTEAEIESVYCVSPRPEDDSLLVRMTDGSAISIMFSGHGTMDMPKERFDAICERGGVSAVDYAELRTYGFRDEPPLTTFAGHIADEGEYAHRIIIEREGARGLDILRRSAWELREGLDPSLDRSSPYAEQARAYVERTIPNFLRAQGWIESIREFCIAVRDGTPGGHAGPLDALAANQATAAAAVSRETGKIERVPQRELR